MQNVIINAEYCISYHYYAFYMVKQSFLNHLNQLLSKMINLFVPQSAQNNLCER